MWEIMITALMRMGVARDGVNGHSIPRRDQRNAGGDQLARQCAAIASRRQAVQRRRGGTVYAIRHQAGCTNDVELKPEPWPSHSGTQTTGLTGVNRAAIPVPTTQRIKVVPPQPDTG